MKLSETYVNLLLVWGKQKLNNLFKINGKPAGDQMSDGQILIFCVVALTLSPRVATLAPTGYGKSEAVAMGVVYASCIRKKEFILASVKFGTSGVVMKKVIDHIFDNRIFSQELELDSNEQFDRLRKDRTKQNLSFAGGGKIHIISLFGKDDDASVGIGEHVPNIILDESPLLSDSKYLQVKKILSGTGNRDNTFFFELGNAINRNHFYKNVKHNDDYLVIDISLEQAIAEGRIDPRDVEENRGLPFFEEFWLCKFPEKAEIDKKGYRFLFSEKLITGAMIDQILPLKGGLAMGVDVGGGGDSNVGGLHDTRQAWVEFENQTEDTMTNISEIDRVQEKYDGFKLNTPKDEPLKLEDENIFIDDTGIGHGVCDRAVELEKGYNKSIFGAKATDPSRFYNSKAEMYWKFFVFVRDGGKLVAGQKYWLAELSEIKYKTSSDKIIKLEPKEDMKKRTKGKSPDHADAIALSFGTPTDRPYIFSV